MPESISSSENCSSEHNEERSERSDKWRDLLLYIAEALTNLGDKEFEFELGKVGAEFDFCTVKGDTGLEGDSNENVGDASVILMSADLTDAQLAEPLLMPLAIGMGDDEVLATAIIEDELQNIGVRFTFGKLRLNNNGLWVEGVMFVLITMFVDFDICGSSRFLLKLHAICKTFGLGVCLYSCCIFFPCAIFCCCSLGDGVLN